jgi:hypothetical protein
MKLKRNPTSPDRRPMIFLADAPLESGCSELEALYVSLNSPVVTLDSLPVGPASAAVALHMDPCPGVTLAVRCVRTGRVAFFTSGPCEAGESAKVLLDAALSFAESMGFLFDEDEVAARGEGGRREAARLWLDLLGEEAEHPAKAHEAPAGDALEEGAESDEILLDELACEARGLVDSLPSPAVMLSKFRRAADQGFAHAVGAGAGSDDRSEPDVRLRLTSRF